MEEALTTHSRPTSFWTRVYQDLRRDLARDLQPERLLAGLNMGFIAGIFAVILAIALAALIFSGEMSGYVAFAVRLTLLTGLIFCCLAVSIWAAWCAFCPIRWWAVSWPARAGCCWLAPLI